MTDITELAQREKFEAWLSDKPFNARYMHWSNTLNAYDYTGIQLAWEAYKAGGAEVVEALETAQLVDDELCKLLPPGVEYMDPPDGGSVTPLEQVSRMVADYRQRIDGLEASHTKLRESMAAIHNTIRLDGASTSLGVIMNAAKRAYEESTSAAGIKWEAE